jgi:hypothetical protein
MLTSLLTHHYAAQRPYCSENSRVVAVDRQLADVDGEGRNWSHVRTGAVCACVHVYDADVDRAARVSTRRRAY